MSISNMLMEDFKTHIQSTGVSSVLFGLSFIPVSYDNVDNIDRAFWSGSKRARFDNWILANTVSSDLHAALGAEECLRSFQTVLSSQAQRQAVDASALPWIR